MSNVGPAQSNGSYRCGPIEIDATQRRVLVNGSPAKLGARAFDLLLALVERHERVVPKRELMDLVWPRLVVEENNLLVHMVALRKLLGPQAIATIPGRGYRFALPIDARSAESAGAPRTAATSLPVAGGSNLPDSPALFGREQDLDAMHALLRANAVVTIAGAGGIGKTRLAMAAAFAAPLESPDGRWWVELASVNDGAQIANSIAAALSLKLSPSRPAPEALAIALSSQNLLLVLDSCEHLADEVAAFVNALRSCAHNVRLIITSQESLKCRDEQVFRLGPLAVPDSSHLEEAAGFGAVALFVARAHAVEPRFRLADDNVALVIDICRRLDGIPLAIELAAARVSLLGVHGLHARLDQMFNVLTGGARMKLRRHQTLRAALDWSYGLLSADEQAVFRRLGVFAGGFTLELAQQVVGDERVDQWRALDVLGNLIDKSLVIADGKIEPRYSLLETARAFALEQLATVGESDAILRRHARALCELMAATDAKRWDLSPIERRRAVQELDNVRAAVDWAMAASSERALAFELLSKCWIVWLHNSIVGEGLERMLKLWPTPSDLPERLEADFCSALARLFGPAERETRWTAARRAEELYRRLGDADWLSEALLLVATNGIALNHMEEAEQALRGAEELITDAAPLRKRAALASTQAERYQRLGAPEQAIEAYRLQADLYRRAGAEIGEYLALSNVGCAQLDAGDVDGAIESLRKAVEGLGRVKAPYGRENAVSRLATALALRGDDIDIVQLVRGDLDNLRSSGVMNGPVLAAAWHHARRADLRRAILLTGYASALARAKSDSSDISLRLQQAVRDRAAAAHTKETIDTWLREGEDLTEAQAMAIAFEETAA